MTHFDEELNREFEIPSFDNVTPEDLQKNHSDKVHNAVYEAIITLIETRVNSVPCMIVNNIVFSVNRDIVLENIDNCISYFITIEEYEKCKVLNDIKNKV